MRHLKKFLLLSVLIPSAASAQIGWVFTNIQGVIIDSERFGTCMALIGELPSNVSCANRWVTFSCSGDFNPSNIGWKKYEQAQIAMIAGNEVRVFVDDARLHNGNCFVERIDLFD